MVKELIDYLNKAEKAIELAKSNQDWVIRYVFMLQFGLNEDTVDKYINKLNWLIENKEIICTVGYSPSILSKQLDKIESLKDFENYYERVK